jgi:hypothetical protein
LAVFFAAVFFVAFLAVAMGLTSYAVVWVLHV